MSLDLGDRLAAGPTRADRARYLLRHLGVLLAGLLVLQGVFMALLVAGQAVPDKPIVDHLVTNIDQGTYGPSGLPDRMGGQSDSFTECVVAGTGLGSQGLSAWQRAVQMPRISNCQVGQEQLRALKAGQPVKGVGEYFRYWAGYTPLVRPALAVWGLDGVRMMVGGLLALGAGAALLAVRRRTTTAYAVGLFIPLVASTNILSTPALSFSQALSMAVAALGVALAAWGAGRGIKGAVLGVSLGAALFNYIDLLTAPAIPWAASAAVVGAVVHVRTRDRGLTLRATLAAGAAWIVAYGLTWASRWAIAVVFLGWDHARKSIGDSVGFRLDGAYGTVRNTFGAATRRNVGYWLNVAPTARVVLIVSVVVVLGALVLAVRRHGLGQLVVVVVLALPALVVPLWYEVLRNHSQIHAFFTYRDVPVAVGIGLAAALLATARVRLAVPPPGSDRGVVDPGHRVGSGDAGQLAHPDLDGGAAHADVEQGLRRHGGAVHD